MRPCSSWAVMLDRGKVGEDWLSVSMFDAAGKFFPEVGEQWIEFSVALTGDGQEKLVVAGRKMSPRVL